MKYQIIQIDQKLFMSGFYVGRCEKHQRKSFVSKIFLKLLFVVLFISFYPFYTIGQSKNEIDRLYEIYKDKKEIQLTTPHGTINGGVVIKKNESGKPSVVLIVGSSTNSDAIVAHLANTINMKLKQGYRPIKNYLGGHDSYSGLIDLNMLLFNKNGNDSFEMAFTKGNMRFLVKVGINYIITLNKSIYGLLSEDRQVNGYTWRIETADTKREAGSEGTEFVF